MSDALTVRFSRSPRTLKHNGHPIREVGVKGSGAPTDRDPQQYLAGFEAGQREWSEKFAPLIASMEKQLSELAEFRENLMTKLEQSIVDLALAIAHKLLYHEIAEGRHRAHDMLRGILTSLEVTPDARGVRIRLNPDDHAQILQMSQDSTGGFGEWAHVEFEPDESLKPSSFSIDSEFGHVLYDVGNQLREIEEFLQRGESLT